MLQGRRLWSFASLMLLAIGVTQLGRAAQPDQDDPTSALRRIERQIELDLLRSAHESLRHELPPLESDPQLTADNWQFARLQAVALLESDSARYTPTTSDGASEYLRQSLDWANRCRSYLRAAANHDAVWIPEFQKLALLLARIHRARGQPRRAVACLEEALELDGLRERPDPIWGLEAWTHLAVSHFSAHDDNFAGAAETAKRIWGKIDTEYQRRALSFQDYRRALSIYIQYLVASRQLEDARTVVSSVEGKLRRHAEKIPAAVWSEVAELHQIVEQPIGELVSLNRTRTAIPSLTEVPDGTTNVFDALEYQLEIARLDRRTAEALRRTQETTNGNETLVRRGKLYDDLVANSRQADDVRRDGNRRPPTVDLQTLEVAYLMNAWLEYNAVIQQIGTLARQVWQDDPDRVTAMRLTSLRGLQNVGSRLLDVDAQDNDESIVTEDDVISKTESLLDAISHARLDNDPQIFQAKVILSSLLLNENADPERASQLLAESHAYWSGRVSRYPRFALQTLVLLAETEPDDKAETLLLKSIEICRRHVAADKRIGQLEVAVMIKLGRLYARRGKPRDTELAEWYFTNARRAARQRSETRLQLVCDVELANIYLDIHRADGDKRSRSVARAALQRLRHDIKQEEHGDLAVSSRSVGSTVIEQEAWALNHLGRLKFLDWQEAMEKWRHDNRRLTLGRSASYEVRVRKYNGRVEIQRANEEAFLKSSEANNDDPWLKNALVAEANSLSGLSKTMKAEVEEAKLSSPQKPTGRLRRELLRMLDEAERLASEAERLLSDTDSKLVDDIRDNLKMIRAEQSAFGE